jgi:aminopeptidase N
MSDPVSGNSSAFVAMMSDFVSRHRNGAATTQNFAQVSSEHFARTPIAQKYGLRDLGWFFNQWVFQDHLPSYELEYDLTDQDDGSVRLDGVIRQTNAPDTWFMALPVVMTFDDDQVARTSVSVKGAESPVQLKLPSRPRRVELDPDSWILSEKTTTRRR